MEKMFNLIEQKLQNQIDIEMTRLDNLHKECFLEKNEHHNRLSFINGMVCALEIVKRMTFFE